MTAVTVPAKTWRDRIPSLLREAAFLLYLSVRAQIHGAYRATDYENPSDGRLLTGLLVSLFGLRPVLVLAVFGGFLAWFRCSYRRSRACGTPLTSPNEQPQARLCHQLRRRRP